LVGNAKIDWLEVSIVEGAWFLWEFNYATGYREIALFILQY